MGIQGGFGVPNPSKPPKNVPTPEYRATYGDNPVWHGYRRNHKGSVPPQRARKACLVSTGSTGRHWGRLRGLKGDLLLKSLGEGLRRHWEGTGGVLGTIEASQVMFCGALGCFGGHWE